MSAFLLYSLDLHKVHALSADLLYRFGQGVHSGAILLIGSGNKQSPQMAERINRRMHLRSLAAFGSILT